MYINGSDLLLSVAGGAIGHCTSHTVTMTSTTKDRAVKPLATATSQSGLFKNKGVTGLSISVTAEGLRFAGETESGFEVLSAAWGVGQSVELKAFKRSSDSVPYIKGKFVIDSIEETSPAEDDATYKISLSNDGEPDIYPGKGGGTNE